MDLKCPAPSVSINESRKLTEREVGYGSCDALCSCSSKSWMTSWRQLPYMGTITCGKSTPLSRAVLKGGNDVCEFQMSSVYAGFVSVRCILVTEVKMTCRCHRSCNTNSFSQFAFVRLNSHFRTCVFGIGPSFWSKISLP